MRMIFVRHGHPDYKKDCLTELGHKHAEAVAERLAEEPITKIYSSTCGRAVETAEHIAARFGNMPIESFHYMRELRWWPLDGVPLEHRGYPWTVVADMVNNGEDILSKNWTEEPRFSNNGVKFLAENLGNQLDKLIAELGYVREGNYYRVERENPETVVMVSHGGVSSAAFAHMFNIPFPFFCASLRPDFTAVTIVQFTGTEGSLITPRFEIANDSRHISGVTEDTVFGN